MKVMEWVKDYKLRDKLRCSPDAADSLDNYEVRSPA